MPEITIDTIEGGLIRIETDITQIDFDQETAIGVAIRLMALSGVKSLTRRSGTVRIEMEMEPRR